MMKSFKRDIELYKLSYNTNRGLKIFLNVNIYIVMIFRISHFFYSINIFIIAKLFWLLNRLLFSIDIDPGAKLGPGLRLVHPIGIVIGRDVISEGDLVVYQNVTIGGSAGKEIRFNSIIIKQPYFKKNVTLYASSVVIGPIVLGTNVVVAANSTVFKDVLDNNLVYGINQIKSV